MSVTHTSQFRDRVKMNMPARDFQGGRLESSDRSLQALPDDLRERIPEQTLVHLALEAVQTIEWQSGSQWPPSAVQRSWPRPLLMTVLAYSYAAGVFGSRDIETVAQRDQALGYLCRSNVPDWNTLRLFRRDHVPLVKQCVAGLLQRVWLWERSQGPSARSFAAYLGGSSNATGLTDAVPDLAHEAARRVCIAIHADSMAMDE